MKQQLIVACIIVCLLTALFAKTERDYSDNTVLVVLTPEVSNPTQTLLPSYFQGIELKQVENLSLIYNEKAIEALKERGSQYRAIYKLTLTTNDKAKVLEAIQLLTKISGVESASPDYLHPVDIVPNDEYYLYQWGLNTTHGIQAPQAWDTTTGSQSIRVGVIDTGIAEHPDLLANLTNGYDFERDNETTNDDIMGHGTLVSGIIGAVGDNEVGVAGVNWNVTLVPLQVSNWGPIEESDIVSAINYATNSWGTSEQISILNQSISGYGIFPDDTRLPAINNYPGLFVWGAGNGGDDQIGDDVDTLTPYIQNFNLSNIIAVGAIESVGIKTPFSNYSSSGAFVHVYAPGSGVLSTAANGHYVFGEDQIYIAFDYDYAFESGTSLSAPHVSGVAALLLSANPALTASQLKHLIVNGADPLIITTPYGQQAVNRLNAHQSIQLATSISNIAISPSSFDFGTVGVNETSPSQDFTITIQGNGSYTIGSIAITGTNESEFDISVAGLPWQLSTGGSATFNVSFSPTTSGVKTASVKIYSITHELLSNIELSGAGLVQHAVAPYTQGFENIYNLSDINWGGDLQSGSRVIPNWGIGYSYGLALCVDSTHPTQSVYTPAFSGITSQTVLSFAYRLNNQSESFDPYPQDHSIQFTNDLVYIEASTTGHSGPYTVIHEINMGNHVPATWSAPFRLLELPLVAYSGLAVNIRFRVVRGIASSAWYFNLDDVAIHDFPAPRNMTANQSVNNVTLHWLSPLNAEGLMGYAIYRNATLLVNLPTIALSYDLEDVDPAEYLYSVRAVYEAGVSNRNSVRVDVPNKRSLPYAQDFNREVTADVIGWQDILTPNSGIIPISGVNGTNGLVLTPYFDPVFEEIWLPSVSTPTFVGVTANTVLYFDYRIVETPFSWSDRLVASNLGDYEYLNRLLIQVHTVNHPGYTTIYEINQTNHIPSIDFTTLAIPLSSYFAQEVKINFQSFLWGSLVIDNVMITDSIVQGPPRNLVGLPGENSVELTWQAPASAIPLGYKVYRGGVAISELLTDCAYYDGAVINGNEYIYYVTAVYLYGVELASEAVTVQLLSESDEVIVPLVTGLGGNYPNPFNPETMIRFVLARECPVVIEIYNMKGQRVRSLVNDVFGVGVHNVVWNGFADDGRSVGSGVYFYRMVAGEYVGVRKMVLLK